MLLRLTNVSLTDVTSENRNVNGLCSQVQTNATLSLISSIVELIDIGVKRGHVYGLVDHKASHSYIVLYDADIILNNVRAEGGHVAAISYQVDVNNNLTMAASRVFMANI